MPTLILKQKITKGYDQWLAAYDGAEELRSTKYGIKTIYRGHELEDSNTINVVIYNPSMDVLQQHMENEAEFIAEAGGDPSPEANVITLCSD